MRARSRGWFLFSASGVLVAGACQEPTEVKLRLSTDLGCDEVHGTTVTVGRPGELETANPAATLDTCEPQGNGKSRLGLAVLVPRSDSGELVGIKVVTAVKALSVNDCEAARGYEGCIVARREFRYLPGQSVELAVPMKRECVGVSCTPATTCFSATKCMPPEVVCSEDECVVPKDPQLTPDPAPPGTQGSAGAAGASGGGPGGSGGDAGDGGTGGIGQGGAAGSGGGAAGSSGSTGGGGSGGVGAGGSGGGPSGAGGAGGTGGGGGCDGPCNTPPNSCHKAQGYCQGGECKYALKAAGESCDDGNFCTLNETCDGNGDCGGGTPRACNTPPGQCYESLGFCEEAKDKCTYPYKVSGAYCNDGNACTSGDTCNGAGTCGGTPIVCNTPPGQCFQSAGTCAGGVCSYLPKGPSATCNDDDFCSNKDHCDGYGECVGGGETCPPHLDCCQGGCVPQGSPCP